MSIGERISELRSARGASQAELARMLQVTRQAVSKWENDLSEPDSLNLIRLADALETDVEFLVTGKRSFGRRPPVVLTETIEVEKVVEKPVVQVVETVVEKIVDKPVVTYVDKPVIKKVYRTKYVRKPLEYIKYALLQMHEKLGPTQYSHELQKLHVTHQMGN